MKIIKYTAMIIIIAIVFYAAKLVSDEEVKIQMELHKQSIILTQP